MSAEQVWLAETIGYPDEVMLSGVFASEQAALDGLRETYGPPYVVEWAEPQRDSDGELTIRAEFARVPNYSTEHLRIWRIWPEPVRPARPELRLDGTLDPLLPSPHEVVADEPHFVDGICHSCRRQPSMQDWSLCSECQETVDISERQMLEEGQA